MSILPRLVTVALVTTGACAASRVNGTRPDDMTATEHLEQARREALRAASAGYRPGYAHHPYSTPGYWTTWYPCHYSWDPATESAALADAHRAAAEELQIRYDSACALVPRGLEATSPLDDTIIGSDPLVDGVVFHLAPEAGPPDIVLAGLRCHRAWLMLEPHENAGEEPVLLQGVKLIAHANGAGTDVMLTVADQRLLPELRRRAALVVTRAGVSGGGDAR